MLNNQIQQNKFISAEEMGRRLRYVFVVTKLQKHLQF